MVNESECPEHFRDWLKKQHLINIESFGRAALADAKLTAEVTAVAVSDGAEFKTIGDEACVAKLWATCRGALWSGSSGGLARVVPNPEQGLGGGTESC